MTVVKHMFLSKRNHQIVSHTFIILLLTITINYYYFINYYSKFFIHLIPLLFVVYMVNIVFLYFY